jgi:arabinose-5-phosphate isomerase
MVVSVNYISLAQKSILEQSGALQLLAHNIPDDFSALVEYILKFKGRVVLMGMGKSGYIAKKIAASLSSTGTPAFYIHPGEASHGDLGMITEVDMVIMISNSGETKELFDTINYCKRFNIKIAAITMNIESTLGKNSDFLLSLPLQNETSSVSAPTTSSLMTLSLGDALVTTLHQLKGFTKEDFKVFHPGGKLGAK